MDNDSFYNAVVNCLAKCKVADLITEVPAGSGVFHIANVLPDQFEPGWVSQNRGRFSDEGEKVRYYANQFEVCAKELGYSLDADPPDVFFIAAEISQTTSAIDIRKLPLDMQNELYSDKTPSTKWEKSQLFMKAVRNDPRFNEINCTYYPSASGQLLDTGGSCLAFFDQPIPTKIIGSGDYNWWKSQGSAR